jgi:DNA-binding response OmpR family regulator
MLKLPWVQMKRILFVDDMMEVYDKLKDKIKVDYADNERDALKKIRSGNYDLVVSDYHLGEEAPQGGLNVIRAAKAKSIECILISRDNHEKEGLEVGADKFIFKKEFIDSCKEKYGKEC